MSRTKAALPEFNRSGKNQFGIDSEDLEGLAKWFEKKRNERVGVEKKSAKQAVSKKSRKST